MPDETPLPPRYAVALDLGQVQDFTGLCVVKTTPGGHIVAGKPPAHLHDVVHLRRYPLGTPYPAIVADVAELVKRPELRPSRHATPVLGIGETGVGGAVVDLFRQERMPARLVAVTITAGREQRLEWTTASVPKLELAGVVQACLQTGRLRVVPGLALAETLKQELLGFRVKMTTVANEVYNPREGIHDDLVLAVAIAVWLAEKNASGSGVMLPIPEIPRVPPPMLIRYRGQQRRWGDPEHKWGLRPWDHGL
jgi:hypothetical protein